MSITIEGLDDLIRRVIREELAAHRDSWLTSREAAGYLGISLGTLHNLVSSGRLPRHGDKGMGLRFRRSGLDAYVEARRGR